MTHSASFLKWVCAAALFLAVSPLAADTVWFSDNKGKEVIILAETDTDITFKQGNATITLPKKTLKRFEYATSAENDRIQADWARKNILTAEHAPVELRELAAEFRALQQKHVSAKDALGTVRSVTRNVSMGKNRCSVLALKHQQLNRELDELIPEVKEGTLRCNELSDEINRLTLKWNAIYEERAAGYRAQLEPVRKQIMALRQAWQEEKARIQPKVDRRDALREESRSIAAEDSKLRTEAGRAGEYEQVAREKRSDYLRALEAFRRRLEQEETAGRRQQYPVFFETLDQKLSGLTAELKVAKIPKQQTGTMHVEALVNGTEVVLLIFDTGASSVTLSRSVAERLGLLREGDPSVEVLMADGSSVQATLVCLDSVKVGSVEQSDVQALIMDRPPGEGVDGLLGMSFLKYFTIRQNESGQIELINL